MEPARFNLDRGLDAVLLVDPTEFVTATGNWGLIKFHTRIANDSAARNDPRELVVLRRAVWRDAWEIIMAFAC